MRRRDVLCQPIGTFAAIAAAGLTCGEPAQAQNCQTVTVEGHSETRTLQNGQSVTAWVPTHAQQVCQ